MRHIKSISIAAIGGLAFGALVALAPDANASPPVWEATDSAAVGTITFYDASGNVKTTGTLDAHPFFSYAVGSDTVNAGDTSAAIRLAQPNPGAAQPDWNVDTLNGFTAYPLNSGPANIQTLSQTHPVSTGANTDLGVGDFIGEFPNTDPSGAGCAYSANPGGCTNTDYENLYQVRLVTFNGTSITTNYDVADILVTGNTWTQVYPGTAPTQDTTALTMSAPKSVRYGASAKFSTKLTDTTTSTALAGAQVKLYRRASASKPWAAVKTLTTSSTGTATASLVMTANGQFQFRYAGDGTHKASTSATASVSVTQVVAIHASPTTIKHGHSVKIWGAVSPSGSGQKVTLQQSVGGVWKNKATATLKKQKLPNGKTTIGYIFSRTLSSKGSYHFRVHKAATSTLAAGTSATVTVMAT